MNKRAMRRNALAKKKAKSVELFGDVKFANNLKACSCAACGNARKFGKGKMKLSLAERKMKEAAIA